MGPAIRPARPTRPVAPPPWPAVRPRLSLQIQVAGEAGALPADRRQLRRWAAAALERDAALVLRLVGTTEGRQLNHQFRGRDKPTNVLTFDYETAPVVHADIVVCLPVVRDEARRQRKSVADHLAHLVVHGVLHAHGWDHGDDATATAMETREAAILQRFGIADPYRRPGAGAQPGTDRRSGGGRRGPDAAGGR